MAAYYSEAYLSTSVNTSDRVELVVALYEGAIAFVTRAIEAIEAGDSEKRCEMIERTSKILMALCEGLDYTQGGGLAGRLFSVYNYQLQQLLEANRDNDVEPLETVKTTLGILLNGWQHVSNSPEAEKIRKQDAETRENARLTTTDGERAHVAMSA